MPGVIPPQRSPGMMGTLTGGLQAAQSIMSLKNSVGGSTTDPNAAPVAGAVGDPNQAAQGQAVSSSPIQRRLDRNPGGYY